MAQFQQNSKAKSNNDSSHGPPTLMPAITPVALATEDLSTIVLLNARRS